MGGFTCAAQLVNHILQLLSKEDGDNGRRRFVGAQPVVIAHICSRLPQQVCVKIHRLNDTCQHQKELDVLMGRVTWV